MSEVEKQFISVPASKRITDHIRVFEFVMAIFSQTSTLDTMTLVLTTILQTLPEELRRKYVADDMFESAKRVVETGVEMKITLKPYKVVLLELVFCRSVDIYLTYISELLVLIFQTRPEALRSNERVSIEFVLQHRDFKELFDALTERKVMELSFKGMRDLAMYLETRMKFTLFKDEAEFEKAIRVIENRNLLIHNRGIVNRRYLEHVKGSVFTVGQPLNMTVDEVRMDMQFLYESVLAIDREAAVKFGTPRTEEISTSKFERKSPTATAS